MYCIQSWLRPTLRKNGKTYFPYLLTCILTVMMFYDLLLVSTNSALDTMPGASQLRLILNFAVTITGGFSAIFSLLYEQFSGSSEKKKRWDCIRCLNG